MVSADFAPRRDLPIRNAPIDVYPLRGLGGRTPAAPGWFRSAVETPFEPLECTVGGVTIEGRAWGARGKPGVILLHGNAAHHGWWSFLAPLLADHYRVATLSFSGMGESGWRSSYAISDYSAELWAMAAVSGVGDAGPPVLVGHSVGGFPVLLSAASGSAQMRAGVLVDSALPGARVHAVPPLRPHRHYPDLESALGRFRLSPDQPCANPWIADYLARMGLKETPEHEWTWRFDRKIWGGTDVGDPWRWLREARAPLAVLRGALSPLTKGENADRMRREAPAGTIFVDIPQAYHHVMVDQPLALIAALRVLLATWLPQTA